MHTSKLHKNHIHKFLKIRGKFVNAWRCGIPGCRYVRYAGQEELMQGLYTLCWECGNQFIFTEDNISQEMPTCNTCRFKHTEISIADVSAFLTDDTSDRVRNKNIEHNNEPDNSGNDDDGSLI